LAIGLESALLLVGTPRASEKEKAEEITKMTSNVEYNEKTNRPTSGLVAKILIGVALAAALGGWWYQSSQVASVRQELVQTQQKMDQLHGQMETSVSVAKTEVNETIAKMNEQVEKARQEALASSHRTQIAAKKQAGEVLTTLSAKDQELTQQIDQIKTNNDQKSAQVDESLNSIKGDVGTVKTEAATTRTELSETIADLKRMTGDMGVMSGLIATNSTELSALRKLGEKDYYEFTLPKTGGLQKVGDIQLALKKSDVKRNKFTLDVMADDRRVEKKDKSINEPVQFYTRAARTPYEVVVNEIRKDQVIGYLSVPKVKIMAKR
jgi:TolA-binding protein